MPEEIKARLCAYANEIEEVDNENYSPTLTSLTHIFMLQVAVHDRMNIQMIDMYRPKYPGDATPLYVLLPQP